MEKVRVTSGKYRGAVLLTPGKGTHPMGAREKLALFNMISEDLPGATVLDAYAGSGALGIEALSRGAAEVIFIEKNSRATEVIRGNLAKLGLDGKVFKGDVAKSAADRRFDVIIADPPYDDFRVKSIEYLGQLLAEDGVLVLSHPGEAPELTGLTLVNSRQYAAAHISVYQMKN